MMSSFFSIQRAGYQYGVKTILNQNKTYNMNWPLLILFGIAVLALIIFLVVKNQKDEKKFEEQLNNDYDKTNDEKTD